MDVSLVALFPSAPTIASAALDGIDAVISSFVSVIVGVADTSFGLPFEVTSFDISMEVFKCSLLLLHAVKNDALSNRQRISLFLVYFIKSS